MTPATRVSYAVRGVHVVAARGEHDVLARIGAEALRTAEQRARHGAALDVAREVAGGHAGRARRVLEQEPAQMRHGIAALPLQGCRHALSGVEAREIRQVAGLDFADLGAAHGTRLVAGASSAASRSV